MPNDHTPAPKRDDVRTFPTPNVEDIITYIEKDSKLPKNQSFAYGDPHPNPVKYPNHVMVYYTEESPERWARWYFAATRAGQDEYNFEISEGDILTRVYILPRAEYLAGTALPDLTVGDVVPAVDTPPVLARYGFTHEFVAHTDKELDSIFITVVRVFQKITQTRVVFNETLNRNVRETAIFVEKGTNTDTNSPGHDVTVDESHTQYDRVIIRDLLPNPGDPTTGSGGIEFPIQLATIPGRANFPIPSLLTKVTLEQQWAIAYSVIGTGPPAFDQDYFFDFKTVDPPQGPYESRTLRFLTDDPQIIEDAYPMIRIAPARETIGIASGWAYSHNDQNQAKVSARQINVPETIHGAIEINEPDGPTVGLVTTLLPPTPGYNEFVNTSVATADVNTSQTEFGLYIVDVVQVSIGGVYNGTNYGFGQGNTGGIEASVDTSTDPVVASATFSPDNVTLDGTATPEASIRVFSGSGTTAVELGGATADKDGVFSVVLNTVFTDAVTVNVTARKSGRTSIILTAISNDLAPAAPLAFLASDGINLTGYAEPGSTVTISPDPVQQEITLTITGTATADGTAFLEVSTAYILASPVIVPVSFLNTETASQVALRARTALVSNSAVNAMFDVDVSGPDVVLTKKVPAPNDSSAYLNITGDDGIGTDTSTITVAGRGDTTVATDNAGNFSYAFDPALPNGTTISITATDAGGTSPATVIVASGTVPSTPTATFDDAGTISGTGTIGSVVVASYLGEEVGTDTVDGSGNYSITLTRLFIDGEEVFVYAHDSGDPNIRSGTVSVIADDLNIPKPVISKVEDIYYGTMPTDLLSIAPLSDITIVVKELQGAMAEHEVTIAANYEWSFVIETLFSLTTAPENGERFDVSYRIDIAAGTADGPAETIAYARVNIPASAIAWTTPPRQSPAQLGTGSIVNTQDWVGSNWSGGSWVTDFTEFLTLNTNNTVTPQIGRTGTFTTGVAGHPGSKRINYQYTDASKNIAWIKVSYMGDGTVVRVRYPGSAIPTAEFTLTDLDGYAFKERVNIPIIAWPYPGQGDRSDTDMTLANLKLVIPPIIEIEVFSPDGRSNKTTHQRSSYVPFR